MLLFIMVPLVLVAFTIAIGPVLAMTVLSHIEQRSSRSTRLPSGVGRAAGDPVLRVDQAAVHTEGADEDHWANAA